ncbi:hypothetical protein RF11_01306 [Thelohanellus kitauei]|uniref:EGF-like domain-containing protein n=1 Tax=Thelohanellus kitauei TaxID=669202 RepID=A0A0C2MYP0_THEKT|nr:hypothetical protein RF11_01306 [Thelohanellus kitauei]
MECYNPIVMNRCKQTEGDYDCSGRGTCMCGTCICPYEFSGTLCETFKVPTVRCSDIKKCMVNVFDSKELTGCNISVTKVKKLEESASFFVQTCQIIHRNCSHSFQIHINKNGTHINSITLKMLDPMEDCVRDFHSFFRKRLLQVCIITIAVAIFFYAITISIRLLYIKWKNKRDNTKKRWRQWIIVLHIFISTNRGEYESPSAPVVEHPNTDEC